MTIVPFIILGELLQRLIEEKYDLLFHCLQWRNKIFREMDVLLKNQLVALVLTYKRNFIDKNYVSLIERYHLMLF